MHGMPRLVRVNAIASCNRLLLLLTERKRAMSWLSIKVTRSSFHVKLLPSCEITESISEKLTVEPNTFRIAVYKGKPSSEMPLLLSNLYESWKGGSEVFPSNHSPNRKLSP